MESTKIKNTLMFILPKRVVSILREPYTRLSLFTLTHALYIINSREIKTFTFK